MDMWNSPDQDPGSPPQDLHRHRARLALSPSLRDVAGRTALDRQLECLREQEPDGPAPSMQIAAHCPPDRAVVEDSSSCVTTSESVLPLVSVLIPVYNRQDLVAPCIESALAQTRRDIEIVVVDNASTDGTWDVCRRYADSDPRVRAFRNESNLGPVRNWSRCAHEARGTYGMLLYSDDTIAPEFLEATIPWLADPEVGFAFTATRIGPSEASSEVFYVHPRGPGRHSSAGFIDESLDCQQWLPRSPGCALFRIADLRRNLRTELPLSPSWDLSAHGAGSDWLMYFLTALDYRYFATVPEPLAFFRVHSGSTTINGLGGEVAASYEATRIWFALQHERRRLAEKLLIKWWLAGMRRTRRPVSPGAVVARFRAKISSAGMVRAGLRFAAIKFGRSTRDFLSTRR